MYSEITNVDYCGNRWLFTLWIVTHPFLGTNEFQSVQLQLKQDPICAGFMTAVKYSNYELIIDRACMESRSLYTKNRVYRFI